MKWVSFWFEGNLAWGQIESCDDWERIRNAYKDTGMELLSAQRFNGAETPYFGFAAECAGQETLGEFVKKNEMKI